MGTRTDGELRDRLIGEFGLKECVLDGVTLPFEFVDRWVLIPQDRSLMCLALAKEVDHC